MQVDTSAIVDRHRKASILEATSVLEAVVVEWAASGSLLEIEWSRMRTLEFQETLRARNEVFKNPQTFECTLCEHFDDHVSSDCFILDQIMDRVDSTSISMDKEFCGQR